MSLQELHTEELTDTAKTFDDAAEALDGAAEAVDDISEYDKLLKNKHPQDKKSASLPIRIPFIVKTAVIAVSVTVITICAAAYADLTNKPVPEPIEPPVYKLMADIQDAEPPKYEKKATKLPILDEYKEWYDVNNDLIGWLRIDGTNIDNPVTQVKGKWDGKDWGLRYEKNMYYINHDFWGNESRSGCIVADFQGQFTASYRPANTILYGHNMSSGLFFHDVALYDPLFCWYTDGVQFYKDHPTITFDTIYEKGTYKVFAAMQTNVDNKDGKIFNYTPVYKFKTEKEFIDYYSQVLDRSMFYNPDVDIKYGDEIIALSTCDFTVFSHVLDIRFVVYARRVRPGESETVDVSQYYVNHDPLMYDAYYNAFGGEWGGRKWDPALITRRYETTGKDKK